MSDIKLFAIDGKAVRELDGQSVAIEKSLQKLIEGHLEGFLGVRFLATEHATGRTHGGRIDTLGIDENGSPVIIEYKRATNQNVINQGLFYLDWLLDHRAEFKLLVIERLGKDAAGQIEWSSPRLLCIAGDFTKYDEHAVHQMDRNIELIRYRKYGGDLLLLELVNAVSTTPSPSESTASGPRPKTKGAKSIIDYIERLDPSTLGVFESAKDFLLNLGDDVQIKTLKWYIAFRKLKNFACVEVNPQKRRVMVYLKLDPKKVTMEDGFIRDVTGVSHHGTGDLRVTLRSRDDFERAKWLFEKSYEAN